MKRIVIAISFLFVFVASHAFAFDFPDPVNYVSDFANIVSSDGEQRINSRLKSYEEQTSIQIFIVTTLSLDGMAVEQWTEALIKSNWKWQAGQKGKDNGIVIAVAPIERRYRVEVGKGLEGDLPDILAKRLAEEYLVPEAKKGDFATGVENLTMGIIKTLGFYTEAEREKARLQREREEMMAREKTAAFLKAAIMAIFLLGGIALVVFMVVRFIKALMEKARKKRVRKEVQSEVTLRNSHIDKLRELVEAEKDKAKKYPKFAQKDSSLLLSGASRAIDAAVIYSKEILQKSIKDPDLAKRMLRNGYVEASNAENLIARAKDLPNVIRKFQDQAPENIVKAEEDISAAKRFMEDAKKEGFFFKGQESGIAMQLENLNAIKETISKSNKDYLYHNGPDVCEAAIGISTMIGTILGTMNSAVDARNYVRDNLNVVSERAVKLEATLVPKYMKLFERIKGENPEDSWSDLDESLSKVAGLINMAKGLISEAKIDNSMEVQNFSDAKDKLVSASQQLNSVEIKLKGVTERQGAIENARSSFSQEYDDASIAVSNALEKVKESYTGEDSKKKAKEAEEKLNKAHNLAEASSGLVNWVSVILMIVAASKLASEAVSLANESIKKNKPKPKAKVVSRSSNHSSYSPSPIRISGGGGGSIFSGGGGGGFGGGGASGGW